MSVSVKCELIVTFLSRAITNESCNVETSAAYSILLIKFKRKCMYEIITCIVISLLCRGTVTMKL